jgi:DNA-binding CsgD family transcriptional regulator
MTLRRREKLAAMDAMFAEAQILSDLIGRIYDVALDANLWPSVLGDIAGFVRGPAAGLVWQDTVSQDGGFYFSWGADPYYMRLHWEKYLKLQPFAVQWSMVPIGKVVSNADLMPLEEFHASRYYKEWAAPQGYLDATSVVLEKWGSSFAHLTVIRHIDDGQVDDEARRRLALVAPHVRRAATIGKIINLQQVSANNLVATLDRLAAAVFLVDPAGRVLFLNAAGKDLIDAGRIFMREQDRLTLVDRATDQMLLDAVARAANGDEDLGTRFVATPVSTSDTERWIAHVLPLTSGKRQKTGMSSGAIAAIFAHKAELDTKLPMEIITSTYRLTASELRVLNAIVTVGQIAEAAAMLGVSEATVKTHLHHLFEKTGVRRQSDLIKLVASMAGPIAS